MSAIEEIRARAAAATPGPWGWYGNTKIHTVTLATRYWGRHFVMGFRRWGMQGAQPEFWNRSQPWRIPEGARSDTQYAKAADAAIFEVEPNVVDPADPRVYRHDLVGFRSPDATFIEHSREDIDTLLAEVDRLRELLDLHGIAR